MPARMEMAPAKKDRFDTTGCAAVMKAVVTTGNGGYDKLVYRDVPVPVAGPGEVLVRVLAAGVNNTDVNTRLGWYSASVSDGTGAIPLSEGGDRPDGGWNAATPFPFIQGTDCCGRVTGAGDEAGTHLIGKRVLIRACMRPHGFGSYENIWMASDFDGAFAEYVKVPAREVFPVDCRWTDVELATIPCSYATAENMLHRANLQAGQHVLITGASGGVGSAAIQLARRRGAHITAITSADKIEAIRQLGCDQLLTRDTDLLTELGEERFDLVVDNVAGSGFGRLIKLLKRGGRYVSSGAIAGPIVEFDMRDLYLKDIALIGCTAWDEPVFPNLVSYIEQGQIRPLVAKVFALEDIALAQQEFMDKRHVGNFVLVPPGV